MSATCGTNPSECYALSGRLAAMGRFPGVKTSGLSAPVPSGQKFRRRVPFLAFGAKAPPWIRLRLLRNRKPTLSWRLWGRKVGLREASLGWSGLTIESLKSNAIWWLMYGQGKLDSSATGFAFQGFQRGPILPRTWAISLTHHPALWKELWLSPYAPSDSNRFIP